MALSDDTEPEPDLAVVAGAATLTLQAFPDVELRTTDIFA